MCFQQECTKPERLNCVFVVLSEVLASRHRFGAYKFEEATRVFENFLHPSLSPKFLLYHFHITLCNSFVFFNLIYFSVYYDRQNRSTERQVTGFELEKEIFSVS